MILISIVEPRTIFRALAHGFRERIPKAVVTWDSLLMNLAISYKNRGVVGPLQRASAMQKAAICSQCDSGLLWKSHFLLQGSEKFQQESQQEIVALCLGLVGI